MVMNNKAKQGRTFADSRRRLGHDKKWIPSDNHHPLPEPPQGFRPVRYLVQASLRLPCRWKLPLQRSTTLVQPCPGPGQLNHTGDSAGLLRRQSTKQRAPWPNLRSRSTVQQVHGFMFFSRTGTVLFNPSRLMSPKRGDLLRTEYILWSTAARMATYR